jgi:hypothetical protein
LIPSNCIHALNASGGKRPKSPLDVRAALLFRKVWQGAPKRMIFTHEDGDHVWGIIYCKTDDLS